MTDDRLHFQQDVLLNGITIWSRSTDVPFAQIRVVIPVGTVHSHTKNNGIKGIAHFLEHMCGERSKLFPEKFSFEKKISECGGDWNAYTDAFNTVFYMQAPVNDFDQLLRGMVSHIFEPLFEENDIALQRDIIMNELSQQKYYPGDNELNQYKFTNWMHAGFVSKEQVFGTDTNLITTSMLEKFHSNYFSRDIKVFVGGTFDKENIRDIFDNIHTKVNSLIEECEPYGWSRREFHVTESKDIQMSIFSIGNLTSNFTTDDFLGVTLMCDILTNQQYGILNNWIRKENAWSYGVTASVWCSKGQLGWIIDIPVNEAEVVNKIRSEIHIKIEAALNDGLLLEEMKNRILKSMCFEFQTISEQIDSVIEPVLSFGINFTETDHKNWLESHTNTLFLQNIYKRLFSKEVSGELMAIPPISE